MLNAEVTNEPGKAEYIISCVFDAPREKVFRAMTDAKLIPQWWGPYELVTTVVKQDLKPGGMWRYIHRDKQGREYAFHGFFHSIEKPARIIQTFEFEGTPGHVLLITLTLKDEGGKTKMTQHSAYQAVADRDAMINAGMEKGDKESLERLAALLTKI